jgi:hypothetical protein
MSRGKVTDSGFSAEAGGKTDQADCESRRCTGETQAELNCVFRDS